MIILKCKTAFTPKRRIVKMSTSIYLRKRELKEKDK